MQPPQTRFADSPEGKIAYQTIGDGPIDLAFLAPAAWNIDLVWDHPPMERYLRRLASFSRLILWNVRGTGPSDPVPVSTPPTLEEWITDYRWVLDAAASDRASFYAVEDLGIGALLFAATFPGRTSSLALLNCHATLRRWDDYPAGIPSEALDRFDDWYLEGFGTGESLTRSAPDLAADERFRQWYGLLERATAVARQRWPSSAVSTKASTCEASCRPSKRPRSSCRIRKIPTSASNTDGISPSG